MGGRRKTKNMLRQGLERYFSAEERHILRQACVGIAGAGGLGSNVALLLARSGIEHFILIDHDSVDASNLNRQYYFPEHVGKAKVEALEEILLRLNPYIQAEKHNVFLDINNLPAMLGKTKYWIEALDEVQSKRLFVEQALLQERFTVSASGISGLGGDPMQRRDFGKNLILVGDFTSSSDTFPPLAPRVTQAAALQADAMLYSLLKNI